MIELKGSEKQISWAGKLVEKRMNELNEKLENSCSTSETERINNTVLKLNEMTSASWWIETRVFSTNELISRVRKGWSLNYKNGYFEE